jgi:hypothetical protein
MVYRPADWLAISHMRGWLAANFLARVLLASMRLWLRANPSAAERPDRRNLDSLMDGSFWDRRTRSRTATIEAQSRQPAF